MIVDTSAIVAIMRGESEAQPLVGTLAKAKRAFMPAPLLLETNMVLLNSTGPDGLGKIRQAIRELGIETIPFTADMAELATYAFLRYGKGRGHLAQLNFADCMSYAAAKTEGMPLLFKGDDFRHTDVECAAY